MEQKLETLTDQNSSKISSTDKKYEHRKFSTRSLSIDGKMDVRIPGREVYDNIDKILVVYEQPMEIDLRGNIHENAGVIEAESTRVSVTGYRENKAESALDRKGKEIVLMKKMKDPEVTMYRGNERIILNQVIGMPIININKGSMTYFR